MCMQGPEAQAQRRLQRSWRQMSKGTRLGVLALAWSETSSMDRPGRRRVLETKQLRLQHFRGALFTSCVRKFHFRKKSCRCHRQPTDQLYRSGRSSGVDFCLGQGERVAVSGHRDNMLLLGGLKDFAM